MWLLPNNVAHEKAHQRWIAREDEAQLVGFMAAIHSDDAYVRYSAFLNALHQLFGDLYRLEPTGRERRHQQMGESVQRDLAKINDFYAASSTKIGTKIWNFTYDKILRVRGDSRGIASYGRVTRLYVLYARQHGGTFPENASSDSRSIPHY